MQNQEHDIYSIRSCGETQLKGHNIDGEHAADWLRAAAVCNRREFTMWDKYSAAPLADLSNRETFATYRRMGLVTRRQRDLACHLELDGIFADADAAQLQVQVKHDGVWFDDEVAIYPDTRGIGSKHTMLVYHVEWITDTCGDTYVSRVEAIARAAGLVEIRRVRRVIASVEKLAGGGA